MPVTTWILRTSHKPFLSTQSHAFSRFMKTVNGFPSFSKYFSCHFHWKYFIHISSPLSIIPHSLPIFLLVIFITLLFKMLSFDFSWHSELIPLLLLLSSLLFSLYCEASRAFHYSLGTASYSDVSLQTNYIHYTTSTFPSYFNITAIMPPMLGAFPRFDFSIASFILPFPSSHPNVTILNESVLPY